MRKRKERRGGGKGRGEEDEKDDDEEEEEEEKNYPILSFHSPDLLPDSFYGLWTKAVSHLHSRTLKAVSISLVSYSHLCRSTNRT